MRLFHMLASIILLAGFAAAALTVSDDMCNDYNKTVCRQNRVNIDYDRSVHYEASDSSAGGSDPFASSRPPSFPDGAKLEISRAPGCEQDIIKVQVTYAGVPVQSANVQLYSLGGGRKLLAHTDTDSEGYAFFSQRKAGRYDILATKYVYYTDPSSSEIRRSQYPQGQIFFQMQKCLLGDENERAGNYGAQGGQENQMASGQIPQMRYSGGMARRFEKITLESGKEAVRVSVSFEPSASIGGAVLAEEVPFAVASSPAAIGFEHDYPLVESGNGSILLSWKIDKMEAGQKFLRSYVLMRPQSAVAQGHFPSPKIIMQNTSGAPDGKINSPSNSATITSKPGGLEAGIPLLGAAALIVIAALIFVFIILPMFAQRS